MFKGKFMWLVSAVWGAIGFLDLVKVEFLPDRFQSYRAVRVLALLSWRTWLLVLLVLLIGLILEGGYTAIGKRDKAIERFTKENEQVRAQLQDVVGRTEGPKIHLIWDVPKDFASLGVKKQRFIIENASDIDAYHVKIEDVWLDQNKVVFATFDEVNTLNHGDKVTATVKINGAVDKAYADDFEAVFSQVDNDEILPKYHHIDDKRYHCVKFPIFVTYKEYDGKILYRSEFLFTLDRTTMGLHTGVRFVGCSKAAVVHSC